MRVAKAAPTARSSCSAMSAPIAVSYSLSKDPTYHPAKGTNFEPVRAVARCRLCCGAQQGPACGEPQDRRHAKANQAKMQFASAAQVATHPAARCLNAAAGIDVTHGISRAAAGDAGRVRWPHRLSCIDTPLAVPLIARTDQRAGWLLTRGARPRARSANGRRNKAWPISKD